MQYVTIITSLIIADKAANQLIFLIEKSKDICETSKKEVRDSICLILKSTLKITYDY